MSLHRASAYRGVVMKSGFGRVTSDDAAVIGNAYWGNIPDGMPVNIVVETVRTRDRFKESGITAYVPLMGNVAEGIVREFLLGDTSHMSKNAFDEYAIKAKEKIDKSTTEYLDAIVQKADSTTSLGSSLMHVIADDQVTYLYKRPYPFQTLIPVEANKGKVANWDSVGPYEITSAAFGEEDPDLTETDMTAHNRSATIKYMYSVGRLTKAVKFAGLSQVPARDIKAIRIDLAQDALRSLRERSMLGVDRNVSSVSNAFTAAANNQYAGVYELITNNTAGNPTDGDQCWYDVSSSSVDTYGEIMQYLDQSYNAMVLYGMQPNLALCDYKTFGIIRRGLAEYFRYNAESQELIPGVSKLTLTFPNSGGLNLVPHAFMPMTTGAYGNIFMMDTRLFSRRVLWQDTYEELANINTSDKFVISAAETLIDKSDIDGSSSLHGGVMGITI
jgi:hypothetical protein